MAFSNVHAMKELDYPTDQDRAEIVLPETEKTGIRIDSLWKRIVFGWRSGKFWEIVFSDLIKPNTRVHIHPHAGRPARPSRAVPLLRLESLRGRGGRPHRLDRQRDDDDRPLSLQPDRGAGRQVRRAFALPAPDSLGQLHRGLGQGNGRRRDGKDHLLHDLGRTGHPSLEEDLSRSLHAGRQDARGACADS